VNISMMANNEGHIFPIATRYERRCRDTFGPKVEIVRPRAYIRTICRMLTLNKTTRNHDIREFEALALRSEGNKEPNCASVATQNQITDTDAKITLINTINAARHNRSHMPSVRSICSRNFAARFRRVLEFLSNPFK
jgi:hypothetical protein